MIPLRSGVLLLLFFSLPLFVFSQKGFGIGPAPSWVKSDTYSNEIPDSADVSGIYYLLYNYQVHAEKKQTYLQFAIKVINDKGLSSASSIEKSFDPSFEKLEFHSLYVQRGDRKTDHLSRNNFEIIQREENFSRATYDGSLSAIVTLKDVKVGDIVVYSYTITGINPVFKDHCFKSLYFNYGSASGKTSFRLVADPSRKFQFKDFGTVPSRNETFENNLKVYTWEAINVPALNDEDGIPYWYDRYNKVQFSDFSDWNQFSFWAIDLFNVKRSQSTGLKKFIDSLKTIDDEDRRLTTAIAFVQEKVRYFSFVDGMSSYRPHDPAKVFDNRYGDCKDKAVLLSDIFNELGVESYPLLVSTDIGRVMDERLPAPWNFNHSIVQFRLKDSLHYIDATITSQRGSLKNIVTPNYYFGVVADKKQPGLTTIPTTKNWSVIRAREDYEVKAVGEPVKLKVETIYTGEEADGIRDSFMSKTRSETDQDYMNFYANDFPGIKLGKSVSFSDDTLGNSITVLEEYDVPDFWKYDSTKGRYVAETYGRVISGYLFRPSTKIRTSPFTLRYPLDVELVTNIHVPESWDVKNTRNAISAPGFDFTSDVRYSNYVIALKFSMHHTKDFVEGAKTADYLGKIDRVYNELGFQITHSGNGSVAPTSSEGAKDGRVVILIIVVGASLFAVGRRLFLIDPRSRQLTERHEQIGGWLILPAIGCVLSPLSFVYGFTSQWGNHRAIFTESFTVDNVVLVANLLSQLMLLALSVLTAILFFKRRTSTPFFLMALYGLNLLITIADITLAKTIYDLAVTSQDQNRIIYAILAPAVWVPYLLVSERSRGTFVQRLERAS